MNKCITRSERLHHQCHHLASLTASGPTAASQSEWAWSPTELPSQPSTDSYLHHHHYHHPHLPITRTTVALGGIAGSRDTREPSSRKQVTHRWESRMGECTTSSSEELPIRYVSFRVLGLHSESIPAFSIL